MKTQEHPIIFFDGYCGLCNRAVDFLIKRDKEKLFRYASLQSPQATVILGDMPDITTFILYENGGSFYRSDAAIRALILLGGKYKLAALLRIFPRFLRDAVYNFIAKKRYKWFGKFDSCRIPNQAERELFL